jgi:hypothetical protein
MERLSHQFDMFRLMQDPEKMETDAAPLQTASVQLSENANADVENGRPSRSRGRDRSVASTPLRPAEPVQ